MSQTIVAGCLREVLEGAGWSGEGEEKGIRLPKQMDVKSALSTVLSRLTGQGRAAMTQIPIPAGRAIPSQCGCSPNCCDDNRKIH